MHEPIKAGDGGEFLPLGWADIPVAWLERIKLDAPPTEAVMTDRELSHE